MSTIEIQWTELWLHTKSFAASRNIAERNAYLLQWHTAASTFYILHPDHKEIDIRVEREVFQVQVLIICYKVCISSCSNLHNQYQDPSVEAPTAIITLHMLYGQHLTWAEGTDVQPEFSDANQITIRLDSTDMATYEALTQWLVRNVNAGAAKSISIEQAEAIVEEFTK